MRGGSEHQEQENQSTKPSQDEISQNILLCNRPIQNMQSNGKAWTTQGTTTQKQGKQREGMGTKGECNETKEQQGKANLVQGSWDRKLEQSQDALVVKSPKKRRIRRDP